MPRFLITLTLLLAGFLPAFGQSVAVPAAGSPGGRGVVYVIPIKEEINTPTLYVLRRGLKEAIERKAAVVVLDMNTPGGEAGVMLEIMEALDKFPG